jgi:peptidoglycan/LPS O-acetylase OafA/YrhL
VLFQIIGITVWTLPTSYLDILFAGCWVAFKQFEQGFIVSRKLSSILLLLAVVPLGYIFFSQMEPTNYSGLGYSIIAAAEFILFLSFLGSSKIGKIVPLTWIGDLSYSLYCIHFPILILFDHIFGHSWLRIPCAFAITLGLSVASRRRFEILFWRSRFTPQK